MVAAGLVEIAHRLWDFEGYDYHGTWIGAAVWLVTVALIDGVRPAWIGSRQVSL